MQKIRVILIVLGTLITANAAAASLASNMHLGILVTYFLGIIFLAGGVFYETVRKYVPAVIRYLFVFGASTAALLLFAVFIYGNINTVTYCEDAVIVLGACIRGETVPSNLKNRLDAAVAYYAKNPDALIVVSGGMGPGEDMTESLAMKRYLLSCGIPEDVIIEESAATSTAENFRYSKTILDDLLGENYSAAFITSDYHVFRAGFRAADAGFDSISHISCKTPFYLVIPNGLRELAATAVQWISP